MAEYSSETYDNLLKVGVTPSLYSSALGPPPPFGPTPSNKRPDAEVSTPAWVRRSC